MGAGHVFGLGLAVLLGVGLYLAWAGFAMPGLAWPGVWAVISDTWLWDLRCPLIPAYVAAALWGAERVCRLLARRGP
ncbi:MAG: hypothetical protein GC206_07175 [Alphaproteobacteria bacterium]|nr:hypothetical protein [Alphaproteobacteria bacterium]